MTKEEIVSEYNSFEKLYNEVICDDNYVNNILSKFIINGSPIGNNNPDSYLPYSARYNSNMDISLPGNSSEYQQAIDIIDNNNSRIDSLIDRGTTIINECSQNLQDSICSGISSAAEIIVDRLNSMKADREETQNLLSTISQKLNEYDVSKNDFGAGIDGNDFILNDGSSSASLSGSSPIYPNNGYDSNTSKSYFNAGMSSVDKAKSIDNKIASNATSIADRLSNIVYGEPPKCPGGNAYPLATPKEGASLNIPSPEEIESIFQEISNDIADMESEIQALEEANAALEQVPEEIIVGYDEDGNPIWGPNPDYAAAQAQIAENNAQIEALNERISECQAVQNELTNLLNTVNKVNNDQMQLSFAADVIKQYDETGVIEYAGRTLSGLEAANLYNQVMDGLKNVDRLALFDDTNGATKPEGYTGMTMSEYDNLMATASSQQKSLDFEAWTELNSMNNRTAAQEKMYQEYSSRIIETMGNNPDGRYLTKENIGIYEKIREENGNPLTKEEREKLEEVVSSQDKNGKTLGKDDIEAILKELKENPDNEFYLWISQNKYSVDDLFDEEVMQQYGFKNSEEALEALVGVVICECGDIKDLNEALAVTSVILNRCEDESWSQAYSTNPIRQVFIGGGSQFAPIFLPNASTGLQSYQSYMPSKVGQEYIDKVLAEHGGETYDQIKDTVLLALEGGLRNNDFLGFHASGDPYARRIIGSGNHYHWTSDSDYIINSIRAKRDDRETVQTSDGQNIQLADGAKLSDLNI